METKQLHLRLTPDEWDVIDMLAGGVLARQQVGLMLMQAAIAAVKENDGRLSLPPHFTVGVYDRPRAELNEATKPYLKRK